MPPGNMCGALCYFMKHININLFITDDVKPNDESMTTKNKKKKRKISNNNHDFEAQFEGQYITLHNKGDFFFFFFCYFVDLIRGLKL